MAPPAVAAGHEGFEIFLLFFFFWLGDEAAERRERGYGVWGLGLWASPSRASIFFWPAAFVLWNFFLWAVVCLWAFALICLVRQLGQSS